MNAIGFSRQPKTSPKATPSAIWLRWGRFPALAVTWVFVAFFFNSLCFGELAAADDNPAPAPTPVSVPAPNDFYPAVSSYHPSFFGWVLGDSPFLHFQVSIKYPFLPFMALGADPATPFLGYKSGLYVAYTGIYDFFLARSSAPVISREQNPGIYFDFNRCFNTPLNTSLGYFHDSDGQVISTLQEYQAVSDHPQDFVSRGWDYVLWGENYVFNFPWLDTAAEKNYFQLFGKKLQNEIFNYEPNFDKSTLTVSFQGLGFLDKQGFGSTWKEENDFWETVAHQPKRSDYDGLRLRFIVQNAHYRLTYTLRSGYTASNLSNDFSFTFRIRKWMPISVQLHNGYGPDLTTYQDYSHRVMLGFELYDYKEE